MSERSGTFETLIKWVVIVIIGLVALKVAFAMLAVGTFLFFRMLPLILFAAVLYLGWRWLSSRNGDSPDVI